jgi:mycoredoxin-dependent peroxiredoxin
MPEIGDTAPDFTLQEDFDTKVTLSDLRGKKVLIFFHPFSYTEICEGEICELRDDAALQRDDLEIINIACDGWPIRQAYKAQVDGNGRWLSDFWPHGEVSKAYGVFDDDWGTCMRGTFLLDEDGVVTHKLVNMGIADRRDQSVYREWLA